MNSSKINRRDWLKKGVLTMAGMEMIPQEFWAKTVTEAQIENRTFLFKDSHEFNEFTPPVGFNEPKIKAILRANKNPYGPPPMAAQAFRDDVFSGNRYAWQTLNNLIDIIAEKENVSKDQIIMAPGSSDLLEKTAMVFFQNGGNAISADPS